ncbi:uncharacterized protein LOC132734542 [Ruditapes philippinarum]|uniref:uncharacterized protein LOC132734542 n=1 Tax=Ruditapes philippinarum TaxID=129788 RepID=UPI00295AD78C|nr:uncharacterized protein LOC132734542 [Ruditapes philippinarum]
MEDSGIDSTSHLDKELFLPVEISGDTSHGDKAHSAGANLHPIIFTTQEQSSCIASTVSDITGSSDTSSIAKQVDTGSTKHAADSSIGPEELESAWVTLQTALGKKSGAKPVVDMVNKLLETVKEDNSSVDYCLVVSDKKSGKSSVIGSPDIALRRSKSSLYSIYRPVGRGGG